MTTRPEIVGYLDERDLDVMPRDLAEHLQGEKGFPFKTPLIRLADFEALAAPAVQGESVGVIRESDVMGIAPYADIWPWLEPGTKLYTAPQPAEQQPAPDVARPAIFSDEEHVCVPRGLIAAACSAIDLGVTSSKLLAELRRYTVGDLSNKPAPDVSALVDALECALETMENVDGANDCSRGIDAVEEALAAHRRARSAYRKLGGAV